METTDTVKFDGSIESAVGLMTEPEQAEEVVEVEAAEPVEEAEEQPEQEVEAEEVEASDDEYDEDYEPEDSDETLQTYSVKVDGNEIEVTLDELKRGYSGQQKIQRGMQENAELRKQTESYNALLEQGINATQQLYERISQQGMPQPPAPLDESLLETDPFGWQAEQHRYNKEMQAYQQEVAAMQQQYTQAQQAAQIAHQQKLAQGLEVLQQRIPAFADAENATKLRDSLLSTGTEVYGFSRDEISLIDDPRAIEVLHDAMMYRETIKGKEKAVAKAKGRPPRTVKAGSKKTQSNRSTERQARSKLKRSGSIDDALSLVMKGK